MRNRKFENRNSESRRSEVAGFTRWALPRTGILLVTAAALCALVALGQNPPGNPQPQLSVVKVSARIGQNDSVGTGFVWQSPTYVVTALHVVAGAQSISVYSEAVKRPVRATTYKVNMAADLALLQTAEPLGVAALRTTPTPPRLTLEHIIWGYPQDVNTMQGDDIRFSRSMQSTTTFVPSIFKSEDDFQRAVGKQGFPSANAQILRIGSIIQHGHSGAPVLDQNGFVVGIADGGLHEGVARINWAIPAMTYLRLDAFRDPPPSGIAASSSLMSLAVKNPVVIGMGAANTSAGTNSPARQAHQARLTLAWSARLSDILDSLPEEEAAAYEDLEEGIDGDKFENSIIDVYEDSDTGATIAVPRIGLTLNFSPEQHQLIASDQRNLDLFVKIVDNSTPEQGRRSFQDFDTYLNWLATSWLKYPTGWQSDGRHKDEIDRDTDYYSIRKIRVLKDGSGRAHARMDANLVIDTDDFLGAVVLIRDQNYLQPNDTIRYRLMQACAMLADFAKD